MATYVIASKNTVKYATKKPVEESTGFPYVIIILQR